MTRIVQFLLVGAPNLLALVGYQKSVIPGWGWVAIAAMSLLLALFAGIGTRAYRHEQALVPKIRLTFSRDAACIADTPVGDPVSGESLGNGRWLRLKAENIGQMRIHDCRARLVEVRTGGSNIIFKEALSLSWAHHKPGEAIDLDPGIPYFVDLIQVLAMTNKPTLCATGTPFRLARLFDDNGTHRFTVHVSGKESKSEPLSIDVSYSGAWDSMTGHVTSAV